VNIPAQIRAGDTVKWRDDAAADTLGNAVTSGTWTLTYYLRTNTASEGATVVGVAYGTGWEFTITAATSVGFDAGQWYWQAVATAGSEKLTLGSGQLTVDAALNYSGTPGAFDGRSQAQKDLDAVQAAIRSIIAGGAVAEYTIGSRRLKKMEMTDLLMLESSLKAEVKREQKASLIANGLGNPHNLFVRF
jgi:hypothetical protein